MKNLIISFLTLTAALAVSNGYATGITPTYCTLLERPAYRPIESIKLTFDGTVFVEENAVATIFKDDKAVATGVMRCSNSIGSDRTEGYVTIYFDSPLSLPKGATYTLIIPENAIYKKGQPTIYNEELKVEFKVPGSLGYRFPSVKIDKPIESSVELGFFFDTETELAYEGDILLYREDVLVRKSPCYVSWDWDLGYAGIDFESYVRFEDGVKYTVTLPQGVVRSLYRDDITNDELSYSFYGGSTKEITPIRHVRCSLSDEKISDTLGKIKFYYDQAVTLCFNSSVQLFDESDNITVKEVTPEVSKERGRYVMTVDFDNAPLEAGKRYSVIIPESTLVTENGEIAVNKKNVIAIEHSSGVDDIQAAAYSITTGNGYLSIENTSYGEKISLFTLDGRIRYESKSSGGKVMIPVDMPGIYILSIADTTYKIVVR